MKKKIISIILALCIAVSCIAIGAISTSAADISTVEVPTCKSRAAFINDFNAGKAIDVFTGVDEKVYKFTLNKNANIMLASTAVSDYGSVSANIELYTDINCSNRIALVKNNKYGNSYFGYLKAATYYIKTKTWSDSYTTYVYAGQIPGNEINMKLSYVKTNNNKTADLKFKLSDGATPEHLYVSSVNFGESSYFSDEDEYTFNPKTCQFRETYAEYMNACTNVKVIDDNGYVYYAYSRVLNKYTAGLSGSTTKDYTGKAVKLSKRDITLKAGYQAISYTTSYKNNKKIGKATVTFKAKNGCIGNYTTTFKIVPSKVKKITSPGKSNSKSRNVKFSWSKSKGATKYVVQTKTSYSGKYKTVKTTKSKSCTLKVKNGTTYVQVYGIKKVKGKTYKSTAASLWVNCVYSSYRNRYDIYVHY